MTGNWPLAARSMVALALTAWCTVLTCPMPAAAIEPTYVTTEDPAFPAPPQSVANSPRRLELWLQALSRSERLLKIKAAEAIAQEAERGNAAMAAAIPALQAELSANKTSDALVRIACARALIALGSRDSADLLMGHVLTEEHHLAEVVEPALAKWHHAPMQDVWLSRLNNSKLPPRLILRAIQGVSVSGVKKSIPRLRELSLERDVSPAIRLAAAQALGKLQTQELEADATKLLERSSDEFPSEALLAATLLSRHEGPTTTAILTRLVEHKDAAVVSMALRRLAEITPRSVEHLNSKLLVHHDPNVRELMSRILQQQQSLSAVRASGELLSDRHPRVRQSAQEALIMLDSIPDLETEVRTVALQVLSSDQPLGQEQAALVVGAIDHKPAALRLVALLDSPNHSVQIHAAWALRKLQVPETAPPILAKLQKETADSMVSLPLGTTVDQPAVEAMYVRLGHQIETLALLQVRDALSTLQLYLPKPPQRPEKPVDIRLDTVWVPHLRRQAVWAIGQICRDEPVPEIVALLRNKFMEASDSEDVRAMAAISLARMKAVDLLPDFRAQLAIGEEYNDVRFSCAWALKHLTGAPMPEWKFSPVPAPYQPTFLEPLGP